MKSGKNKKTPSRTRAPSYADADVIPTLTDVVAPANLTPAEETLTALQDELATRVQKLVEELLHSASREMEAMLLEKVIDRLRARLPELVDETVRSQFKVT